MNWRDYQEKVAQLFLQLGCSAKVNEPVKGARGKHNIDVWVVFRKFGILIRWVIDCKYWNKPVPIGEVEKLNKIIENIGADRGFLISEKGFQKGAFKAAKYTNITLVTFSELRNLVREDLHNIMLEYLEKKAAILHSESSFFYIINKEKKLPNGLISMSSSPRPGLDYKTYSEIQGKLAVLTAWSFENIRIGKDEIPMCFDSLGKEIIYTNDIVEFIEKTGKFLDYAENWIYKEKTRLIKLSQK